MAPAIGTWSTLDVAEPRELSGDFRCRLLAHGRKPPELGHGARAADEMLHEVAVRDAEPCVTRCTKPREHGVVHVLAEEQYLRALEQFAAASVRREFFTPIAVQYEIPNRLLPREGKPSSPK